MIDIYVRSASVAGTSAGTGQEAAVISLAATGITWSIRRMWSIQRMQYTVDWHLDHGDPEKPVQRLEQVGDFIDVVEQLLHDASERGLHVAYTSQHGSLHEFWPATALPIVSVQ